MECKKTWNFTFAIFFRLYLIFPFLTVRFIVFVDFSLVFFFRNDCITKKSILIFLIRYRYFRHPSYLGFFLWATGTQVLLCNPISFTCYVLAAWKFFSIRIPFEEGTLLHQYKRDYADYIRRTWIGIPFITSTVPEYFDKKET